jgi:hypothetical protein
MPQVTTRPNPPRDEYDFQDICADLLKEVWKATNLQVFGRRGQRQNGVDILDLSGSKNPRGAQCKNYEPLEAIDPAGIREIVSEAKLFSPPLSEFWIMTTAKKSVDAQLEVLKINAEHRDKRLFSVVLKTWDELLSMFAEHQVVADKWFGGGVTTELRKIDTGVQRITDMLVDLKPGGAQHPGHTNNRLLLRWQPKFRRTAESRDGYSLAYTADYSVILLTIEEIIAAGATELAVELSGANIENLIRLAPSLENRIVPISDDTLLLTNSILRPTMDEFHVELRELYDTATENKENNDRLQLARQIIAVFLDLNHFLVGMRNRLQVDIEFEKFLSNVEVVRTISRNPQGRMNLAEIEGILRSYRPFSLNCVQLRPAASPRAAELFSVFVQDSMYESMSRHACSLGYPKVVAESGQGFSEMARTFVQSSKHKKDVLLGELSIAAALESADNSQKTKEVLRTAYLPPVVSFAAAREKASNTYETLGPRPIWPIGSEPGA